MEKVKSRKTVIIFTIISTIITLVSVGFNFSILRYLSYKSDVKVAQASSIAIIGGADGPTAVYIASRLSPHIFTGVFGLISIAGMIYLFFSKKTETD